MQNYQVKKSSEDGYIKALEGIERKTLAYGDNTLMVKFKLTKGCLMPSHKHPQEQTGYLISGHIVLTIDGERHEMHAGDSWCIKGNVEHYAEAVEDSIVLDIFSPVREDYI